MTNSLTNKQRRWLGTAIAIATADNRLVDQEIDLIEQICLNLQLDQKGRAEVEAMIRTPPTPVELASWTITAHDRMDLYISALKMAAADGYIDPAEDNLIMALASVLQLTPEEIEQASEAVGDSAEE